MGGWLVCLLTLRTYVPCCRSVYPCGLGTNQVETANDAGATPLYIAVQKNHVEVTKALLNAGANPDATTKNNSAPLTIAVFHCNLAVVRLLLAAGAHIDITSGPERNSVAMLAAFSLDVDVLCELVLFGASLNWRNRAGACIDDVLRTTHGLSLRNLAFYCVAHYGSDDFGSWAGDGEVGC